MSQIPPPTGTPPMGYQSPGANKPQGLAIGALVCGILSLVLFCFGFVSIPLGLVAIVLAIVAKGKIRRGEAGGEGLAKTGMILGIIGVAVSLLVTVMWFAGVGFLGSKAEELQRRAQEEVERMEREAQESGDTTAAPTTSESL